MKRLLLCLTLLSCELFAIEKNPYEATLEELSQMTFASSATLTKTEKRKVPAALTHITSEDIENSGARGLDELLKIYVPGLQTMMKINGGDQLGIRGIISDRNNKFLILVNGRVMNEKTEKGAISERALSMLGDIQYIDVIRGPGSVLYGPGALAGVINIVTHNGDSFDGVDVQIRQGFIEEFSNIEIRLGHTFEDDSNLFLYYGIDNYRGANNSNAPHIFSTDVTTTDGAASKGHPVPSDIRHDNRSYLNRARQKFHLQYQIEDLRLFLRYTRGGKFSTVHLNHISSSNKDTYNRRSTGYQQLTLATDYTHEINSDFRLEFRLSYDLFDSENEKGSSANDYASYREDEYYARFMAHWSPDENHQFAIGLEYSHEQFAKRSPGFPNIDSDFDQLDTENNYPWNSDTNSLLAEHQWYINEYFTTFLGLRVDQTDYTSDLLSGRVAVVYTPTETDTIKFVYNHSVRRMDEVELRSSEIKGNDTGETEKFNNYEMRYDRLVSDDLWAGFSAFYVDYDIIAYLATAAQTKPIGNLDYYGLEMEIFYQTDKAKLAFAHSFIQQLDFKSASGGVNNVTASDLDYGDDLANWFNHQTTVNGYYQLNDKWKVTASLMVLWRNPGGKDLAKYNKEQNGSKKFLPLTDNFDRAWQESIYLSSGLEYKATDNLSIRLDAYHILGWIDKEYNKINEFQRTSHYQNQAASVGITVRYKF